ncbi:MAG TPA: biopolymer transporter ExbD, partial [Bacteroidetes bacterium]|nr:biopolymer transporter ExbD [Bacteroidota bacterium]
MAIKFKRRGDYRRSSSGSMADIAFLLLIFFLVATTIFNEKGIKSTLPEWKPDAQMKATHVDHLVKVFVNGKDQILYQDRPIAKKDFEKAITDNLSLLLKNNKDVEVTVSLGYD